jgi:Ca-activated chloride channel family protein
VSFDAPLFLLGLLAVPVIVWAYLGGQRRRHRAADAFVSPALRPAVARWDPAWRRHAPMALFALALTALLVALARPQATVAEPIERANVMLVIDESSSMRATDVDPTRLEAAHDAADSFLDEVPGRINVGLVAFSTFPRLAQVPTGDREAVRGALDLLRAEGSTATGDAMDLALAGLQRPRRGRRRPPPAAIVLLSDGRPTRGRDPYEVARRARARRIPVHTVALGTEDGVVRLGQRNVRVPPDVAGLRRIARLSGGRNFSAEDAEKLKDVYRDLAERVATRERKREVSAAFAAGALVLMLAGAVGSLRWFARPV